MSCERFLSMLSAYIDGEVQAADSEMIEQHLATCASCARECELLRGAARMLSEVPEIDPPAFLMEHIEAATVNKTPVWEQVRAAFSLPRWVAAGAAVAAAAVGFLVFQSGMRDASFPPVPVAEVPAAMDAERTEASPQTQVVEVMPPERSPDIAATSGSRVGKVRSPKTSRYDWNGAPSGGAPVIAEAGGKNVLPQPGEDIVIEGPVNPESSAPEIVVAEAPRPVAEGPIEVTPQPVAREVKITAAPGTDISAKIRQNADALEQLREQIAASNKSRQYKSANVEGMERRVYSVELANIRF